jgi:hypothetical protein
MTRIFVYAATKNRTRFGPSVALFLAALLTGCGLSDSFADLSIFPTPEPPPNQESKPSTLSIFGLRGKSLSSISFSGQVAGIGRTASSAQTTGPEYKQTNIIVKPGGTSDGFAVFWTVSQFCCVDFRTADQVDVLGGTFDVFETGAAAPNQSQGRLTIVNTDYGGTGLNYATYGIWELTRFDATGGVSEVWAGASTLGFETTSSSMPQSGSATYTGRMDGRYSTGLSPNQTVTGFASLEVDYSEASLSSSFSNVTVDGQPFRDINGTGVITGNSFTGALSTDLAVPGQIGPDMDGTLARNFYGPAANEVGGVFELSGGDAFMVGGFVGN